VGVRKKEARLDGRHRFRHIMLALFETPAGFALFKVLNEGKLDNAEVRILCSVLFLECLLERLKHRYIHQSVVPSFVVGTKTFI
jgi:hypothetical protein